MLKYLAKASIKKRLTMGFGVLLVLMIVLTVLGIQKVNFIDHTLTDITDVNSVKQRFAINYRGSVHDRAIAARDLVLTNNNVQLERFVEEIRELERFYADSEKRMSQMLNDGTAFSDREKQILNNIEGIQSRALPVINQLINLTRAGEGEQARVLVLEDARSLFIEWLGAINQFIDYQEEANKAATPLAREVANGFQNLMLLLTTGAIMVGLVVSKLIEKSLISSLGGEPYQAAESLSHIAQGNLAIKVETPHPKSMLGSLATMKDHLSKIVAEIVQASDQVSQQSLSVATGSSQVFDAAQQQAQLTHEATRRLQEMREEVNRVSEISVQTEQNSQETTKFAKQGKETINQSAREMEQIAQTVNETVEQVKKLESTTAEIGGIVNVITGISEQTNLLALNAAIEAARAGESGRGFAVVADEVRQLAQRTGEATNKIEAMINEVQAETMASVAAMSKTQPMVESGRAHTLKADELLVSIETQAEGSLANVRKVAEAAQEQVEAIIKISEDMDEINRMSQDSIDSLQKNQESTKSLSQLSDNLKGNVGYFNLATEH